MLISVAACAAADTSDDGSKETTNNNLSETTAEELKPNVPDKNYNGIAFTFLARDQDWVTVDIFSEMQTGEPINDAVWQRNSVIEEKFNIFITEIKKNGSSLHTELNKAVSADERI